MENHPIPQDVTGFQFKLIGEMTIKQFAYLAGGVILAWITYALPLFGLIKFPLIFIFAGLGVCLAFIPIEGRPFDIMLTNFFKALTSPTEFIYKKSGYVILPTVHIVQKTVTQKQIEQQHQEKTAVSEKKLQSYLNTLPKTAKNSLDEREMRFLGGLPLQGQAPSPFAIQPAYTGAPTILQAPIAQKTTPFVASSVVIGAQPLIQQVPVQPSAHLVTTPDMPTPPQLSPEDEQQRKDTLEKEAAVIQQELTTAKQQEVLQQNAPTKMIAHEKVIELEQELSNILAQKDTLQNQLISLKKELAMQKQQVFTPSIATAPQTTQNVRMIPQGLGKSVGLPITPDTPNLLTGIVKDPRNNSLPNILVEVKDKDGNPVRAFKTNGLGQFAAATPLANGIYLLTFEDPNGKQKFDTIELPVIGNIIQPLEIISVDAREQLRKELFQA